jgi:hypothetical protein
MNINVTSNNKWISFLYVGKETIFVKKIVQKHQQKYVSYKTKNITGNLIAYSQEQCNDKYSKNVI